MINATELRNGAVFKDSGQLLQVVTYEHIKMGRGSGTIKVKVKNLRSGSVTEKSFITGAKVEEADVQKKKAQFLYQEGDTYNFMDPQTFEQFSISKAILGDSSKFLKDGLEVTLIVSDTEALALELPNSLVYTVSNTGPGEKGNSVSNVFKDATLDNGLTVKVPMFIDNGDKVKINTRSSQYVERVK